MNSAFYEGLVTHARYAPSPHAFRYRLGLLYLDLDELDALHDALWPFSVERPNLVSFRRSDYLGDAREPLKASVVARVVHALGRRPRGPIRLLTHPRYFGYCFNPVSFYYCFDEDGVTLDAIVAEITNTPWQERHAYVLDARRAEEVDGALAFTFDKAFHVSPFLPMDLVYRWHLSRPSESLRVQMDLDREGARVFRADLVLRRAPLDARACLRGAAALPPTTLKVMLGIHYEALRVHLKGNPFYEHPDPRRHLSP